ncbi:putative GTP-binding protein 6 isoform X2 [Convolutriloba macropyga]|uniref:putative GTP-binding protein 6 isoform X2 n=1 Tax=Convolutriloba macropyga TaxID=536237 RepID=UPI003F51FE7B
MRKPNYTFLFKQENDNALRLSEAQALVRSVPNWRLDPDHSLTVYSYSYRFHPKTLFRPQKLAHITQFISENSVDIVFINVPQLTSVQFANLSKLWRRFVIDRYILVLSIFRLHATSKEAKLQVARLLVSLIKHRVENNCLPWYLTEKVLASKGNTIPGSVKRAKGAVTSKEMRRLTVQSLEAKVKSGLEVANTNRSRMRKRKIEAHLPLISVIGYTNCGKTTLIKALTKTDKLTPENKLFATTEASSHFGFLEHDVPCIFNDTVGFISDMPHSLIDAFTASFEEISTAQIVVHVTDISHRDWRRQMDVVNKTVDDMTKTNNALEVADKSWIQMSKNGDSAVIMDRRAVVHVFNKSDKLKESDPRNQIAEISALASKSLLISATTMEGVGQLKLLLFERLLECGFLREETITLDGYDTGEYEFLTNHASVVEEIVFNVSNSHPYVKEKLFNGAIDAVQLKVLINYVVLKKFASSFPNNEISKVVFEEIKHENAEI